MRFEEQRGSRKFRSCVLCISLMAFISIAVSAATPKVTTVAGGYLGNGKPATSAALANPNGLATDSKGNTYIADSNNCQIRKVNRLGVISKFAGTGICGYSGDGGPAKSAMISGPEGLALDTHGNLLFADIRNSRIRMITPGGTISTIAGNGTVGYSGDGGSTIQASLAYPASVSSDPSGNVYIADYYNYVIRKVDTSGIIHTVAGNHSWGFSGDGGPATSAQLCCASSVLADGSGSFYIAELNQRVRKVDSSGIITTYAGNGQSGNSGDGGPASSASIGPATGLQVRSGKLYISTYSNVWMVTQANETINLLAGDANAVTGFWGDGNPALSAALRFPGGLAFDRAGNLLIADSGNNRIRRIDTSQIISTIAGGYLGDGTLARTASVPLYSSYEAGGQVCFDSAGNIYIAETADNRIRKISTTGIITTVAGTGLSGYWGDGGPAVSASLWFPTSVAVDNSGNIFIADTGNHAIRKVNSTGTITTVSLGFFIDPLGLVCDTVGNLYVTDWATNVVWKITPTGSATIVAGVQYQRGYNGDGIPANQAWLSAPTGVKLDIAGNLYIADWANYRIRKVDTNGVISTVAGNGVPGFGGDGGPATAANLNSATDVATDAKGNLYIADFLNLRVRVVDPSGTINTYAGTGAGGYNGNGLAATATNITPSAVATNADGVLYFTDEGSYRVRKVH